ncbi:MAG: ABC transporter permease, partial [Candidatus Hodarchaeota archaeon]
INILDGENIVTANTIIISKRIQDIIGKNVGDKIDLSSVDPRISNIDVTIGGVMSNEPYFANKIGFLFILVDIVTLVNVIPDDQKASLLSVEIDVSVSNFVYIEKTSENIKDRLGLEYYVFVEKDISEIQATGIRAYQSAMNLVIIASLFVEFLFITNILIIAIRDRQNEFGILRAVGCGPRQLIILIGIEILLYSITGCILGVFVGISFSTLLIGLMGEVYTSLEFQAISIRPASIITTFLSGIIVALIAGLYPIFIALKMPIIKNIHSQMRTHRSSILRSWKYSAITGILLIITGYLLQFFIGPSYLLDFSLLSTHFVIVILIFLGTVLLEIALLIFLPRIANKILIWFGLVTRTIAMRNLAREFQKSLFTIMTSAMALTFIIVVGLTSAAITDAVPDYFQNQWGGIELVAEVRDATPQSISFTENLDNRSDIKRSSYIQETRTEIEGINGYIFGVDPLKYAYFSEPVLSAVSDQPSYELLNGTAENTKITGNTTTGLISHLLYQKNYPQLPLGSNVSIRLADDSMVNITLSAVIKGNVFLGGGEYLYITSERYQQFFNSTLAKWFVCDVEGDISAIQHSFEVEYNQFKEVIGITFFKNALERSLVFQTVLFHVIFLESFILSGITQFVCILVSTLRTEREMGIIRSMGLHKKQVFTIFMAESIALAFSALIFGIIDGLLGSILLTWYISLSIPVKIQFPFDRVILWVFISFTITMASTLPPSYRSSQSNLVATISGRPMTRAHVEKSEKPFNLDRHIQNFFWGSYSVPRSLSFWGFLNHHKKRVQITFLILLAIGTIYYIFDQSVLIRGLVISDYIWRSLFLQLFVKSTEDLIIFPPTDLFLYINPLFLFLGLAAIGPIVSFFLNGNLPKNLIRGLFQNFISAGVAGILVCFILFT